MDARVGAAVRLREPDAGYRRCMRRDPSDDAFNDPNNVDPIRIVPATPDPLTDDRPTQAMPVTPPPTYTEPTLVMPTPPVVVPQAVAPQAVYAEPVYAEPLYAQPVYAEPPRRWGAVAAAALLALLIGGIVGVLIGRAGADKNTISSADTQPTSSVFPDQATVDKRVNDVFTLLVAESQQPGGISTPTPYPQLDQLLGILQSSAAPADTQAAAPTTADQTATSLSDQVAALQQQNTDLQSQLAAAKQQRDDLQATLDSTGGATSDLQHQLDQQAQQINQLQSDLDATKAQLATAQDTLTKLNIQPIPNLVGKDIGEVRNLAKTNQWTLIEKTVDPNGAPPNSVTAQTPAAGERMVTGGVLYVEVAKKN